LSVFGNNANSKVRKLLAYVIILSSRKIPSWRKRESLHSEEGGGEAGQEGFTILETNTHIYVYIDIYIS
jgi:hypothetical protein